MRVPIACVGVALLAIAVLSGCGDDAAGPEERAGETTSPASERSDGSGSQPTGDAAAPEASAVGGGSNARTCDGIFSMDEAEALLGEPATLSEVTDESLGHLVCTWETIEDPDDLDDLTFGLVIAQVFSGDPIDGGNFVDPSLWPDRIEIDGIGDLAFATDARGVDFQFVDGQVAGTFDYTFADLGDAGATAPATSEQVEAAFRTMHDRVMGG